MTTAGVYKIENLLTHQVYIGSSIKVEIRLGQHRRALAKGRHKNKRLQSAWDEFGPYAFDFSLIERVAEENLAARETALIAQYSSANHTKGYNIFAYANDIGENTRQGYRESRVGRKLSPEHRAAISKGRKGMKFSASHCAAIARGKTGASYAPRSIEARQKMSRSLARWHAEVGHSEETRRKISETKRRAATAP